MPPVFRALHSLSAVYQGLGFLYFRQGDLPKAIALLERGLGICRSAHLTSWLPETAAPLSAAHALAGRLDDAVPLLRHALEQSAARDLHAARWRVIAQLSEVYPLAHRLEEMRTLVHTAVERSRAHHEPGCHAWALRMLGELYAHQDPPQVQEAAACYQDARVLAAALGMRPLLAHCHLGLGAVYEQMGRPEPGRAELSTALDLYRAMGMVFWLQRRCRYWPKRNETWGSRQCRALGSSAFHDTPQKIPHSTEFSGDVLSPSRLS